MRVCAPLQRAVLPQKLAVDGVMSGADDGGLTAELLRECRTAAAAVAAEAEAEAEETAALRGRWPLKWSELVARGGVSDRAAAAQTAAAELAAAPPPAALAQHTTLAELLVTVRRSRGCGSRRRASR